MKNKVITFIILLTFIAMISVFSYAYLVPKIEIFNKTETLVKSNTLDLIYMGESEINENSILPGDSFTKTFSVENTNKIDTSFNIYMENVLNEFNEDLVFSLLADDVEIIKDRPLPVTNNDKSYLLAKININNNTKINYKLIIEFKVTNNDQTNLLGKSFNATLGIDSIPNTNDCLSPIIKSDNSNWNNENVLISFEKEGYSSSGVDYYEYYITNNEDEIITNDTIPTGTTKDTLSISNSGINYIYYRTVSNSGLVSEWSNRVKTLVDKTSPIITLLTNSDTIYSKSKSVSVNISDDISGISKNASFKYGWSSSRSIEPTSYTTINPTYIEGTKSFNFVVSNNTLTGNYYLWITPISLKDLSSNEQNNSYVSIGTFNFDNTPPTITITSFDTTASEFTVYYSLVDDYSSVASYSSYYSIDDGATYTKETNNCYSNFSKTYNVPPLKWIYYKICATDSLGNERCVTTSNPTKSFTATNLLTTDIIANNEWYNGTYTKANSNTIAIQCVNSQAFLRTDVAISVPIGHKIYGKVNTNKNSTTVTPGLYIYSAPDIGGWHDNQDGCSNFTNSGQVNTWKSVGCSYTNKYQYLTNVMLSQANETSSNGQILYSNFRIYDLTSIFGVGHEPSDAWCNSYLP